MFGFYYILNVLLLTKIVYDQIYDTITKGVTRVPSNDAKNLTKIVYDQIYDTISKGVTRVPSNGTKKLLTKMLCIFKLVIPLLED